MAGDGFVFNRQWSQLDTLLSDHQSGTVPLNNIGIRKDHWAPRSSRSRCSCNKNFSLTERPSHCRRCGELFCKECTSFQRRLNILAHPDPNGKLYKVCQGCFDQGPQEMGQSRALNEYFAQCRLQRYNHNTTQRKTSLRGPVNVHVESDRLRQGFSRDVQQSKLKKVAHDIKSMVSDPEWLKSNNWILENLVPSCRFCAKSFGMLRSRHHCAFCNVATCAACVTRDVIIYVSDVTSAVNIAVIEVTGCPEKEPDTCMYLRTCVNCRGRLESLQVSRQQEHAQEEGLQDTRAIWREISEVEGRLRTIQAKIDRLLPEYQELVEALEISPGSVKSLPQRKQSNTQLLAKAQGDLADHLTDLVMTIHGLKKFSPNTSSQNTVLRNIIKAQCGYYQENMFLFRETRRKLEEVTPKQVLECIQVIVDKNAINSCYICVKQLCLEVLHLSTKYSIGEELPAQLAQLEQVLEVDLQRVVESSGEDYSQHQQVINLMLQLQLKEHRLVKSSRIHKAKVAGRVTEYTREKAGAVLTQVHLQLVTKVAHRSFTKSKAALEATILKVKGAGVQDRVDGDWTLLD